MSSLNILKGSPTYGKTVTNVNCDVADDGIGDLSLMLQKIDVKDTDCMDLNASGDQGNSCGEKKDDTFNMSVEEGEIVDSDVSNIVGTATPNNSGPSTRIANDSGRKSPTVNSDEPGSSFLSCSSGSSVKQQLSPKYLSSSSTANGSSPLNNTQVIDSGKISPISSSDIPSNEEHRDTFFSDGGDAGIAGENGDGKENTKGATNGSISAFGSGYGIESKIRPGTGKRSFGRYSAEIGDLEIAAARKNAVGYGGNKNTAEQNMLTMRFVNMSPLSSSAHESKYMPKFSLKVFVGGLPPDIDEEQIATTFRQFGAVSVDWPHKSLSGSLYPPKGYAFLLYNDEISVQRLVDCCFKDEDKLYFFVSSPTIQNKLVQVRPWYLADASYILDTAIPLDPRKTVFVGGVPRPLKAFELFMIMDRLFGGVCFVGIDTDPILEYPKGAGRVVFANHMSYIAAVSARFVQLHHGDIDKRVEVKPYVFDNQLCDICQGHRCDGKYAPYFCANVACLQYYCENCWPIIHSRRGREYHKPLVKESGLRSSIVPFRWF